MSKEEKTFYVTCDVRDQQLKEATRIIRNAGFRVKTNFVSGYPEPVLEDGPHWYYGLAEIRKFIQSQQVLQ